MLGVPLAAAALLLSPGAARANIVRDYVKSQLRGDMDPLQATITLLNARGTLLEVNVWKEWACTASLAHATCCPLL